MLSKEERKQRNILFWDLFKKETRGIPSSNGRKMNWVNYPTDVKTIFLRMELEHDAVRLCFDIQAKDDGIRAILYEQMTELKKVLENCMTWETRWLEHYPTKDGRVISRILWENTELNFYNNDDFPQIINFLKDRIVEFDNFYQEFKDILVALAE
ncbi:MAG: DUF4268 domain-containing protein [Bacteroidota bacterium]